MNNKIYHIYVKDRCLAHSVNEEEFAPLWNTLKNMIDVIQSDYKSEDLTFEELSVNKEVSLNSSH